LLISMSFLLPACSGGGGGGSSHHDGDGVPQASVPSISNLQYSPDTFIANEGGGAATMTGTLDFVDNDGNLSTFTVNSFNEHHVLIYTFTEPLQNVGGMIAGKLNLVLQVNTASTGNYTFEFYVTDYDGNHSNILTGTYTLTEPSSPLSELYGLLTLNYKFNNSSTIYTERAHFSQANLDSEEPILVTLIEGSSNRAIACGTSSILRTYMCLIKDNLNDTNEVFLFNLNNGQITDGLYEYCADGVTYNQCASDMIISHDGTVWGNVNSSKSATLTNASETGGDDTSKATLKLNVDENGTSDKKLSSQQQEEIGKLSTHMKELYNLMPSTF